MVLAGREKDDQRGLVPGGPSSVDVIEEKKGLNLKW